jgi:precorrin-6B methylase 1
VHAVLRSAGTSPAAIADRLRQTGAGDVECTVVEPSLEDVFLEVASASARPAP